MTNAEARFNNSLPPRKPECSLGRTVQDGHLDSHTAPKLWAVRFTFFGKHTQVICGQSKLAARKTQAYKPLSATFVFVWPSSNSVVSTIAGQF